MVPCRYGGDDRGGYRRPRVPLVLERGPYLRQHRTIRWIDARGDEAFAGTKRENKRVLQRHGPGRTAAAGDAGRRRRVAFRHCGAAASWGVTVDGGHLPDRTWSTRAGKCHRSLRRRAATCPAARRRPARARRSRDRLRLRARTMPGAGLRSRGAAKSVGGRRAAPRSTRRLSWPRSRAMAAPQEPCSAGRSP